MKKKSRVENLKNNEEGLIDDWMVRQIGSQSETD